MRIIQLDETQTDISTRAHFHPLAIRLYGQHGINAAGPTGSEVRQASPPPPKPLLSPFIPSPLFFFSCHPLPTHPHTHFCKPPLPVNNKPPLHSPQTQNCGLGGKLLSEATLNFSFLRDLCFAARGWIKQHLASFPITDSWEHAFHYSWYPNSISSLPAPAVLLRRAQRRH